VCRLVIVSAPSRELMLIRSVFAFGSDGVRKLPAWTAQVAALGASFKSGPMADGATVGHR